MCGVSVHKGIFWKLDRETCNLVSKTQYESTPSTDHEGICRHAKNNGKEIIPSRTMCHLTSAHVFQPFKKLMLTAIPIVLTRILQAIVIRYCLPHLRDMYISRGILLTSLVLYESK